MADINNPRDRIVFYLNGARREVQGDDALLTVSEYVRGRGLVGTKVVCAEGDCGSCTVLVGRPAGNRVEYLPIDSCIQFVFQLDGAHLVTVEGLADPGELTPVQRAMVDCHGSQCGFCTPGFVMAMTGVVEQCEGPVADSAWRDELTGNLCRCTGYSQIFEAGQAAAAEAERLEARYPSADLTAELAALAAQSVEVATSAGRVSSPTTFEDALRFRGEHPGCCVVAGATDLGVQRNKGRDLPPAVLDLNRVDGFRGVDSNDSQVRAGAGATWTELLDFSRVELPELAKVLSVFGSPQIRHAGTIGGNIINASPIADSLPLLHVLNAELVINHADNARMVNINDFYRGYKEFDLAPNELLCGVNFLLPPADSLLKLYKVSRRRDLDISTFTAAILLKLDGDTITEARLAYGAVGPTVLRLPKTEEFLIGRSFAEQTMRAAGDVAVDEITPITDVRGSSDYRCQLARNVLLKFHAEHQHAPT